MLKIGGWEPLARSILHMVVGFTFSLHGFQKLLGLFGGMGGRGATAPLLSLMWTAGVLETFGGLLLLVGLFTRPVAFVLAGEMAFAYFHAHQPRGLWPIQNGGELAVMYCFVFLYLFVGEVVAVRDVRYISCMRTGCISRSCHLTRIFFLLLAGNAAAALLAQPRPDLSGVWKLQSTRARYSEIWRVKHTARDISIRMDIKDAELGDRVLVFEAPFDGMQHKQTVIGTPASVSASWDGNALFLEIERQARPELLLHTRRRLRLAAGGKRLESRTTQYSPPPVSQREDVFDRQ